MTATMELIEAFERRDFAYIADLVRNDVEMNPQVRQRLADLILNTLSGRWRRMPKRPRSADRKDKMEAIAANVQRLESEGVKKTAAIAETAALFKRSPRWVSIQLKRYSELHVGDEKSRAWEKRRGAEATDSINWLVFVTCHDVEAEDDSWMYQ